MNSYEDFCAAIHTAWRRERATSNRGVTCSHLWDQIVYMCLGQPDGFRSMFAWDTRKANDRRNRIGTIQQAIARGDVPGLALAKDDRGRTFVVESKP